MKSTTHNPGKPRQAPVAAHPLFPAIVALWLAALLAIGGMMLPVSLLERAAAIVHLDALVPAARPPLGFTARLLVAFALALIGAGAAYAGAALLRRRALATVRRPARPVMAAPSPAEAERAAAPEPAADDDEDLSRLAAAREAAPHRRALTSESADAPSILEISALPALQPLTPDSPARAATEAPPPAAPAKMRVEAGVEASAPGPRFRTPAELAGAAALRLCAAPLESLGVVQLVERFALALHARRLREAAAAEQGLALPLAAPVALPPFAEPRESLAPRPAPAAGRPFNDPASGDCLSARDPAPVDPAPAEPAPSPLLARRPSIEPSAAVVDLHREDSSAPESDLVRWALPEPEDEGELVDEDLTPDPGAGDGYSSLLAMRPSTRVPPPLSDFVRVEDLGEMPSPEAGPQPVVVFPGQAQPAPPVAATLPGMDSPPTPEETEQALRSALAALQKMSGAA